MSHILNVNKIKSFKKLYVYNTYIKSLIQYGSLTYRASNDHFGPGKSIKKINMPTPGNFFFGFIMGSSTHDDAFLLF
jgi:hypothetical protein